MERAQAPRGVLRREGSTRQVQPRTLRAGAARGEHLTAAVPPHHRRRGVHQEQGGRREGRAPRSRGDGERGAAAHPRIVPQDVPQPGEQDATAGHRQRVRGIRRRRQRRRRVCPPELHGDEQAVGADAARRRQPRQGTPREGAPRTSRLGGKEPAGADAAGGHDAGAVQRDGASQGARAGDQLQG